jgi:PAS domain S-box-containing protein
VRKKVESNSNNTAFREDAEKRLSERPRREQPVDSDRLIHELDVHRIERKKMEEALRESEARWQFALEGSGDGVWDWDAVTNHVYFSVQWKAMFGYAAHEIGNTLDEWDRRVHPDDKAKVYADLERHFHGETAHYQNEHRVLCKDGSYKWVLDRRKVIEWTEDGSHLFFSTTIFQTLFPGGVAVFSKMPYLQ